MTTRQTMHVGLGNEGIRIVLLRVKVGHEREVVGMLRKYLEEDKFAKNDNIIDYKIYKVLGLYDIMIILQVRDFSHDLLNKGSFKHVILANEILCFSFSTGPNQQGILSRLSNPAVLITLIKLRLDPLLVLSGNILTRAVAEVINNYKDIIVMGGLGWNELIAIYPNDFAKPQIHDIFSQYLGWISGLSLIAKDKRIPLVHKTYSFMGVSYEVMDNLREVFPDFFGKGDPCPWLHLSVTADNLSKIHQNITEYFKEFKIGDPNVMMGVYDISIPFNEGPWGGFLDQVVKFRKDNADLILDTRIELSGPMESITDSFDQNIPDREFPFIDMPKDHASAIIKEPGTAHLISTVYCFNHFIQNPLIQDCFLDLYLPARKLITALYHLGRYGNLKEDKGKLNQLTFQFQWAMRERAMGAYLFTEDDEHSFSPIKGGLQKILLAMESIPFNLLTQLMTDREIRWQGFISIGLKHSPEHFMENIHIPFEHILRPEKYWWCLIHETGHILTSEWKVLNRQHNPVREAISHLASQDKLFLEYFDNMADNCFADTFDFLIGFLGNRELYFKICWEFLLANSERNENPEVFFRRHLIRHFFGWIFEAKFITKRIRHFGLKDVGLRREEAVAFLQRLEDIPGMTKTIKEFGGNRDKFSRKLSEDIAPFMFLLDHFYEFLRPVLVLQKELKREYNSKKFIGMVDHLVNNGEIIQHQDIKHPHLLPLKLMENCGEPDRDLDFRARFAVILSLYWYSHHKMIPKIFDAYQEAQILHSQSLSTQ